MNLSGCMVDTITFMTQALVFEEARDSFLDDTSLFVGLQRLSDTASLNSLIKEMIFLWSVTSYSSTCIRHCWRSDHTAREHSYFFLQNEIGF